MNIISIFSIIFIFSKNIFCIQIKENVMMEIKDDYDIIKLK